MKAHEFLQHLADGLRECSRQGSEKDEPEGMRWIEITDTLSKKIEASLSDLSSTLALHESETGEGFDLRGDLVDAWTGSRQH